jgi:hypothetical protein
MIEYGTKLFILTIRHQSDRDADPFVGVYSSPELAQQQLLGFVNESPVNCGDEPFEDWEKAQAALADESDYVAEIAGPVELDVPICEGDEEIIRT